MLGVKWNLRQLEALELLASEAQHILLYGGSRSGKTFLLTRQVCMRALKAPMSRHVILRFRLAHVKSSIVMDTFPKVMRTCFPTVKYELNKSDLYATMPNGSEIWFGGLDDKDRTERILGNEYATIYFNECSQIPWNSRNVAITRLAQRVDQIVDNARSQLVLKAFYDENPPDKGHWTYRMFIEKRDPESRDLLPNGDLYASYRINPVDNVENLGEGYIDTLKQLSGRFQKRFLLGEFREAAPNALFTDEILDRWRVMTAELPEMVRSVVAVDPSGADDTDNIDADDIGIIYAGLGIDGVCYIAEDLTCKAGPATWGRVATDAYDRHAANTIVGEVNYGGAMVAHVIRTARPGTPFQKVTASRGKVVRADPIAALCETGKVRIVGRMPQLEDELCAFTTHGYVGDRSPNRADAMIWAVSALLPKLCQTKAEDVQPVQKPQVFMSRRAGNQGWMG
jgi:phage terminase large subunit-like protein